MKASETIMLTERTLMRFTRAFFPGLRRTCHSENFAAIFVAWDTG